MYCAQKTLAFHDIIMYDSYWPILPNLLQNRKGNRDMYVCNSNLITLRVRVNLQSTDQPPPCEIAPLVRSRLWSGCSGWHHSCSNLSASWSHEGPSTGSLPQGPTSEMLGSPVGFPLRGDTVKLFQLMRANICFFLTHRNLKIEIFIVISTRQSPLRVYCLP